MKKMMLLSFVFILVVCVSHMLASVQGTIRGTVTDKNGNPIEEVRITVMSMQYSTVSIALKSNKKGEFIQIGLQPDYYQIRAEKDGYLPVIFEKRVGIQDMVDASFQMEEGKYYVEAPPGEEDFKKGNEWYSMGKFEEAAKSYQEAINKEPEEPIYYNNLGTSLAKLQRFDEAIEIFRKMLEVQPESYSANKSLGELYGIRQEYREALPFFAKAAELSSDDPDAFFNLGACQLNTGASSDALANFNRAIQINANYAVAYYQAGMIYVNMNRKDEAIQYLEKFIELAPEDPNAPIAQNIIDYLKSH